MNGWQFFASVIDSFASVIDSLAWPALVGFLFWLVKDQFRAAFSGLAARLRKFSAGSAGNFVELSFGDAVTNAKEMSPFQEIEKPQPDASMPRSTVKLAVVDGLVDDDAAPVLASIMRRLLQLHIDGRPPRLVVMEVWALIEKTIDKLYVQSGGPILGLFRQPKNEIDYLVEKEILTPKAAGALYVLMELRDVALAVEKPIYFDDVKRFMGLTKATLSMFPKRALEILETIPNPG